MPPSQSSPLLAKHDDRDGDDLSQDQVKQLLRQAEQRLLLNNADLDIHATKAANLQSVPKLNPGPIAQPYITLIDGVARADHRRLLRDEDKRLSNTAKAIENTVLVRQKAAELESQTLGSHFNMPRTSFDNTLKADLSLLKLRGVLDPKQHYKKDSSKSLVSEYSEVGRISEGSLEYKTRLPNRERKRTLVEEVLANEYSTRRFKKKYYEIQSVKSSGKRAYYKTMKSKRSGGVRKA